MTLEPWKIAFALALLLLLSGCTESGVGTDESSGNASTAIVHENGKTYVCRNVTREEQRCWDSLFNYTASALEKGEPYRMDVFCIGAASVQVRNLEKKAGKFTVEFHFTSKSDAADKTVVMVLGPGESGVFEEKFQFSCPFGYEADSGVLPPAKQVCRQVNVTREECTGG